MVAETRPAALDVASACSCPPRIDFLTSPFLPHLASALRHGRNLTQHLHSSTSEIASLPTYQLLWSILDYRRKRSRLHHGYTTQTSAKIEHRQMSCWPPKRPAAGVQDPKVRGPHVGSHRRRDYGTHTDTETLDAVHLVSSRILF